MTRSTGATSRRVRWAIALATTIGLSAGALATAENVSAAPVPLPPSSCDPIDPESCLFPFPNDYYTVADPSTATGRRLNILLEGMPENANAVHIDPTEWNRMDGFSPGSFVTTYVPGIDLEQSGIAPITDIGSSLDPDAPIVLWDATAKERWPYWGELDKWSDPAVPNFVVRPARNFTEGHRYIVVMRNLKNAAGERIPASDGFLGSINRKATKDPYVRARRPAMKKLLRELQKAKIKTRSRDLNLMWDFTIGSGESIAGRMLHIRDDAYDVLGAGTPAINVTSVEENPNANLLRRVRGTFEVPLYLTGTGEPGSRFNLGAGGMPEQNGTYQAEFRCLIPKSTVVAGVANPGRGIVYGHGLLGSTNELEGHASFANTYNAVICATPWIGMSNADFINVLTILQDISTFPTLVDRLQQAHLNFQFLARLLKDPNGFAANAAFQVGTPLAPANQTGEVFYNGNSQGGILGGAATAVSKEWTRAVLGVPGINFSTLIPRSVDFDQFFGQLTSTYPNLRELNLLMGLIQILWDRGEGNGYAQHLTTDPYPGTPEHQVLLIAAFGDHQVANIATEVQARTIGAHLNAPGLTPGRIPDVEPFWDIPPVPTDPFGGSVLEMWDFGTPAPPLGMEPNRAGSDPHGAPRNVAAVRASISDFLMTPGTWTDRCGATACVFP